MKEPDLVKNFYIISIICGFFAILTTLLMNSTIDFITITIITSVFGLITVFLLYKYPRIRGIVVLMVILIVVGYLYLVAIDLFIIPIDFIDINIFGFIIPTNILISLIIVIPGLLLWYFITIKYFWSEINKMKEKKNVEL